MTDKFALSDMDLDEISLVPAGDNMGARVVLAKTDPTGMEDTEEAKASGLLAKIMDVLKGHPESKYQSQGSDGDTIGSNIELLGEKADVPETKEDILKGLSDEVRKSVEDLIATEREEAEMGVVEAIAGFEDSELAKGDDDDDDEYEDEDDVLSKADPAVRALFAKMQGEIDTANFTAATERETRLDRDMLSKAADYKNIPGTPEEKAVVLKTAYATSNAHGKAVEQMMKASNAALDASADLLVEIGKGTPGDLTVGTEVESKAEAIRKSDPTLTREQAIAKVYADDPSLYDSEIKEG